LAWSNVRERRAEIGLLRAIGKSSWYIAGLFLGRAILLGLLGGGLGCAAGLAIVHGIGRVAPELAAPAAGPLTRDGFLFAGALVGAPLVCLLASYLPTLRAVLQDPALVLRDG